MVQGGSTLKVTAAVLAANFPANIINKEASESPASGALSTTLAVSKVTPNGTPTAYTLAAGAHGATKTIVCETFTTGTAVVTVTSGKNLTTLTFATGVGGAAHLQNIDGYWYVIGTSATRCAVA